jgi:hypothetical protein
MNAGKFFSSSKTGGFSRRAQLHEVSLVLTNERNVISVAVK